jgi:hypothetical protein
MSTVDHSNMGQRARLAGANALMLLLTLAVPPQAANAVLYISRDMESAYDHLRKEFHSWVSYRVLRRHR